VFNLRNSVGVTSALLENHPSPEGLLQETGVHGLSVLSSGPLPPNAAELLGSERMRELLVELTAIADIVVLDSPPTTALSDASILATQKDGVLLVLDAGKTRRELAKRAAAAMRQVNAHVLGVVLNRVPLRGAGYSYYYYSYQYGQYYGTHEGRGDGNGKEGGERKRRLWDRSRAETVAPANSTLPPPV